MLVSFLRRGAIPTLPFFERDRAKVCFSFSYVVPMQKESSLFRVERSLDSFVSPKKLPLSSPPPLLTLFVAARTDPPPPLVKTKAVPFA